MRRTGWVVLGCAAVLSAFVVAACGDDATGGDGGAGGDSGNGSAGEGSSAADSITKTIGSEGGSIELDGAVLTFPPGAVSEDTEITAKFLSSSEADALGALPAGASYRSTPVAFTPHGATFAEPVGVELTYTGPTGAGLAVGRLDDEADETWGGVSGSNFADGKATFTLSAFSVYAVIDDPDGALAPLPEDYYETTSFAGFITLDPGDATGVTEAFGPDGGLPYCVTATVPDTAIVQPRIRFTLDEPLPGGTPADFVTDPAGSLVVTITDNAAAGPMRVFVETGQSQLWCASALVDDTTGLPWSALGSDCVMADYIPAEFPPQVVGVELGQFGAETGSFDYDICITDVAEVVQ